MSTEREYDVAVVGASLAGSTVATLLGRAGARVALIEGHADPSAFKRTCTHYIQASGAPVLERLGALPAIELAGGASGSLEIWSRYGWVHPEEGEYSGWNIRRERLDPLLRGIATSTEGVDAMLGETVVELRREGERVAGVMARSRDGEEREIRARLVVGADGRDSTVARLAGLPERVRPNNRFGYWAYFRDLTVGGRLWMLDPDVAYTFPTDGGLTLLACLLTKDRLPAVQGRSRGRPAGGLRGATRRAFARGRHAGLPHARQARRAERGAADRHAGTGPGRRRRDGVRSALGRGLRLGAPVGGVAGRGGGPGADRIGRSR